MSRTTTAIALAMPAGALLAIAVEGLAAVSADTIHTAGVIVSFTALISGAASAAWFGPKAAIEGHQDKVRARRHRGHPAPRRILRETTEASEPYRDPVPDSVDEQSSEAWAHQLTPEQAQEFADQWQATVDAGARDPWLDSDNLPGADARTMPAAVDADGWPATPFATAEDATRDLAGLGDTAVIPADVEDPDGWEQLRVPAVTRSTDDLLWHTPATPA